MSMNGFEKITDRILSGAETEAAAILKDAEEECARIRADYAARADEIRERLTEQAQKEGTDRITRAKSSVATQKRNYLLRAQSELLDSVFEDAMNGMKTLDTEKYTNLLTGLLTAALLEQLDAEVTSRTLYGEEDAMAPETYEAVLNQRDRERCGAALIENVKKKLTGKVPAEKLARLVLSEKTANIDGGVILRYGDIESNCSLMLLFSQLRESLEADVSHALFDAPKQN